MDAALGDAIAGAVGAGEDFRIDQGAFAVHMDMIEDFTAIQLEGAIHVLDVKVKEQVHEFGPGPAVKFPQGRVLPINPKAGNNIAIVDICKQLRQFPDIKLSVAVGVEDPFFGRGAETGLEGAAVTAIDGMMHHADIRIRFDESIGNFGGTIGAAIVDDDNFKVVANGRQHLQRLLDHSLNIILFVVTREKDRKTYAFFLGHSKPPYFALGLGGGWEFFGVGVFLCWFN